MVPFLLIIGVFQFLDTGRQCIEVLLRCIQRIRGVLLKISGKIRRDDVVDLVLKLADLTIELCLGYVVLIGLILQRIVVVALTVMFSIEKVSSNVNQTEKPLNIMGDYRTCRCISKFVMNIRKASVIIYSQGQQHD